MKLHFQLSPPHEIDFICLLYKRYKVSNKFKRNIGIMELVKFFVEMYRFMRWLKINRKSTKFETNKVKMWKTFRYSNGNWDGKTRKKGVKQKMYIQRERLSFGGQISSTNWAVCLRCARKPIQNVSSSTWKLKIPTHSFRLQRHTI